MIELLLTLAKTTAAIALVILAVSQIYRPWPWTPEPSGAVLRQFRLPLWARLRLHSLWLLGAAILVGLAATPQVEIGILPLAIVGVGIVAIAALPVRYTITAEGIYVGRTPLRRWTQFAGLSTRNGWIFLQPVAGSSGLLVRSPGGADGDALLTELRGLVRRSYKGESSRPAHADVALGADGAPEGLVA
jgi:hypothetical protein